MANNSTEYKIITDVWNLRTDKSNDWVPVLQYNHVSDNYYQIKQSQKERLSLQSYKIWFVDIFIFLKEAMQKAEKERAIKTQSMLGRLQGMFTYCFLLNSALLT